MRFAADGSPGRAFADASAAAANRCGRWPSASSPPPKDRPTERLRAGAALAEADETKRAPGTKAAGERDMLRERLDALGVVVRDLGHRGRRRRSPLAVADAGPARWPTSARRLGPARLAKAYAAVEEARQALDRNVSFKAVADWVALEL